MNLTDFFNLLRQDWTAVAAVGVFVCLLVIVMVAVVFIEVYMRRQCRELSREFRASLNADSKKQINRGDAEARRGETVVNGECHLAATMEFCSGVDSPDEANKQADPNGSGNCPSASRRLRGEMDSQYDLCGCGHFRRDHDHRFPHMCVDHAGKFCGCERFQGKDFEQEVRETFSHTTIRGSEQQ